MRKKVVYLGVGFVILGIILVVMGFSVMTDIGLYYLSNRVIEIFNTLVLVRSIMNWLGITFSIGGAVTIIAGVYLDELVQFKKEDSTSQQSKEIPFFIKEPLRQNDKTGYCFQCGAKFEGNPHYCFECGTKLR